jgi:secreted PhoX family phosphatase
MRATRRRDFLRRGAATLAGVPLAALFERRASAGLGALQRDPDTVLDLPPGFRYAILERAQGDMDDGYRVPGQPDAMACFPGAPGTVVLMRNHEVGLEDDARGPYRRGQAPPPEAYSPLGRGGVSRLVLDAETFQRRWSNMVLLGTARNCAGGISPWGWLTCEESMEDGHGYVFLCRTDAERAQPPQRLRGYGRFYHEAAAVHPGTLDCYLTEDRTDGCLYRFRPRDPQKPFEGTLSAMRVVGHPELETADDLGVGDTVEIDWVDIADPDPGKDVLREQAHARGAALVRRGEGLWVHDGVVWFASTTGGQSSGGQIFRLWPGQGGAPDRLQLVAEAGDPEILDQPDNITIAPWGGVFMVEDGSNGNHVRGLDAHGGVFDFARNAMSASELSGVCFDPTGRAMFVNIQQNGLTLVITGPFQETFARAGSGFDGPPAVEASAAGPRRSSGCSRAVAPALGLGAVAAAGALGLTALRRRRRRARRR